MRFSDGSGCILGDRRWIASWAKMDSCRSGILPNLPAAGARKVSAGEMLQYLGKACIILTVTSDTGFRPVLA